MQFVGLSLSVMKRLSGFNLTGRNSAEVVNWIHQPQPPQSLSISINNGSNCTDKKSSSNWSRADGPWYRVSLTPWSLTDKSYVAALHAKVPLTIYDPSPKVLSSALTKLDSLLGKDVSKNRITQADADSARERVKGVNGDGTSGEVIEGVDLVIEVRSSTYSC
jgi:hypothetical protein